MVYLNLSGSSGRYWLCSVEQAEIIRNFSYTTYRSIKCRVAVRIVPVPVEIGAAGTVISRILYCQIFAGNGLVTEQRLLMAQQRGPQNRELLVDVRTAEAICGLQHGQFQSIAMPSAHRANV